MDINSIQLPSQQDALQKLISFGLNIGEPEAIADIQDFILNNPCKSSEEIYNLWMVHTITSTLYGASCILQYPDPQNLDNHLRNFFMTNS